MKNLKELFGQPNTAGSGSEIWEGKSYWFIGQKAKTRSKTESECENCAVVSDSLWSHGLYSPWNSPGQNTGVGSLSLLQGIFPTQGSNPGLLCSRWTLYQLSHKRSPRVLEWVAYPFSSGSSWPRNWTGLSCIAGGFFSSWAIRGAQEQDYWGYKSKDKCTLSWGKC